MMLRYASAEPTKASPLVTADGTPYLAFALDQIDKDYGGVESYLARELDVTGDEIRTLRELYLE